MQIQFTESERDTLLDALFVILHTEEAQRIFLQIVTQQGEDAAAKLLTLGRVNYLVATRG